jgi:hypothetical protein
MMYEQVELFINSKHDVIIIVIVVHLPSPSQSKKIFHDAAYRRFAPELTIIRVNIY